MLTGLPLLLLILAVLLFIVIACAIFRWHPFLVLLVAAIVMGLCAGFSAEVTLTTMLQGGGSVFASIGFIIALGTVLGEVLEKTGAVLTIAKAILRRFGPNKILPGMSLLGTFTGIPVFCDSGFIILSNLARSLSHQSSATYGAISIALATGLYTSHVLIPPTPGPLAAAGNLGMAGEIGWVILLGMIVSIPAVVVGWFFAKKLNEHDGQEIPAPEKVFNETLLPLFASLLPLLLPVILIAFGSVLPFLAFPKALKNVLQFVCNPNIALLTGVLTAFILLGRHQKKEWNGWIQNALLQAGPILLITAAGGALGAVIKATPLADDFKMLFSGQNYSLFLFYPVAFLLAAGLKTAQGSSTASLIITSSIIAPLVAGMPMPEVTEKALLVLSIGAGAMSVSHANDSYFWVINQYSGLPIRSMYRYFTTATLFMGLAVLVSCMLLSFLF